MFKIKVKSHGTSDQWFQCKVLNISGIISMINKIIDNGKSWLICCFFFCNNKLVCNCKEVLEDDKDS